MTITVSQVIACEHTDDDDNLIAYETPIAECSIRGDVVRWYCPAGAEHEAGIGEL